MLTVLEYMNSLEELRSLYVKLQIFGSTFNPRTQEVFILVSSN